MQDNQFGISLNYLKALISFLVDLGHDRGDLIAAANLTAKDMEQEEDVFHYGLDFQAFANYVQKISGNQNIGAEFGITLSKKDHGYIAYAAGNMATLGEAIQMMARYSKTRCTALVLNVFDEGEERVIQLDESIDIGDGIVFWSQMFFTGLLTVAVELFGVDLMEGLLSRGSTRLTYPDTRLFDDDNLSVMGQVTFNYSSNQVRLPLDMMSMPPINSDTFVAKMAQEHCEEQLLKTGDAEASILAKVRTCFLEAEEKYPNLESVSSELNMSSRSLKRKLKNAGTSYQEILDNVRKGQAVEYLVHTNKTIEEIANLLGFSDPSNFGRAFRKWTDMSPRDYRKSH